MEQIFVASMLRHVDAREVIRNTKNGFTKGKLCLSNLVAVCNGLTTSEDEERPMGFICLDFCKVFEVFPHNILVSKWKRYGFDGWNIKWIRNWTDGSFQRLAVNSTLSLRSLGKKWRPSEVYTGTSINQYIY